MINQVTYYLSRSCALNYIFSKTNKDKSNRANIWLADEVEELTQNPIHRFIVLDDEDAKFIANWNIKGKEFLESIEPFEYENL